MFLYEGVPLLDELLPSQNKRVLRFFHKLVFRRLLSKVARNCFCLDASFPTIQNRSEVSRDIDVTVTEFMHARSLHHMPGAGSPA